MANLKITPTLSVEVFRDPILPVWMWRFYGQTTKAHGPFASERSAERNAMRYAALLKETR